MGWRGHFELSETGRPAGKRRGFRRSSSVLFVVAAALFVVAPVPTQAEELAEDWVWVISQNFRILTDAPPEQVAGIASNLERFRAAFARLAPGMSLRSPVPVRVVAFRSHRSYAPYKRPSDPRILGQFVRNLDGHYLTFHAGATARYAVDYHEYVHYLVDGNLPAVPRWFNEGLAEYYSTFKATRDTVTVGLPVERHRHWFAGDAAADQRSLSYDFSLLDVLSGEAAHDGSKVGGFYAFSWGLVHYLLSGPDERLVQTADFLAELGDGVDPERAFERAFGQRLDTMEEAVREYVLAGEFEHATLRMPFDPATVGVYPARRSEVEIWLGDLAAQIGYLNWADRHFQTALEVAPGHPDALAGLAFVRDLSGRRDEATLLFRDAVSAGSREPRTYLRYGRHLLTELLGEDSGGLVSSGRLVASSAFARSSISWLEDPVTAERAELEKEAADGALAAFRKALSLSPKHAGAQVHLGIGHLYADVDPDPGLRALGEVRRWLPQDRALAFYQLQLYVKKKEFSTARRLLTQTIGDAYPQLSLRGEEEIDRAERVHRAGLALGAGEVDAAIRLFDEAISLTSDLELRERMSEILIAFERELDVSGEGSDPAGADPEP
ncbi:MAG: hypothetical protein AAGM22_18590 [Acidobacteriota bacterium]